MSLKSAVTYVAGFLEVCVTAIYLKQITGIGSKQNCHKLVQKKTFTFLGSYFVLETSEH